MEGDGAQEAPFSYTEHIYEWLDNVLDLGITEECFWNMTLAEINRAAASKHRIAEREAKEKAVFDYVLADMIGRSIARIHSKENHFPEIEEAYPTLFKDEEAEQRKAQLQLELSVMKLHQITNSLNKKFRKEEKAINDE